MPYIPQRDRTLLDECGEPVRAPGELNYLITKLCLAYIQEKGIRYSTLNETVGVLECVKLEMYRRLAAPYEDQKIAENGDVYPLGSS